MIEKDKMLLMKFCFYFIAFLILSFQLLFLIDLWLEYNTKPLLLLDLSLPLIVVPWYYLELIWLELVKQSSKLPEKLIHFIKKWCANPWFWIAYILITFVWIVASLVWFLFEKTLGVLEVSLVLVAPFGCALGLWAKLDEIIHNDNYVYPRISPNENYEK